MSHRPFKDRRRDVDSSDRHLARHTEATAVLTFASGIVVLCRMYETLPSKRRAELQDVVPERAMA